MAEREFPFTRADFEFLRRFANARTGIAVGDEKYDMFYSRLSRRVRALGLASFSAYCDLLCSPAGGDEAVELVNAVTTNLTAFFRESHHFEYLRKHAIGELQRVPGHERKLDIWSAGCSTGEEAYSLAIVLDEMAQQLAGWNVHILATDIDSNVLHQARSGVYPRARVEGLTPARLRHAFQRGTGGQSGKVRVRPELRARVDFCQLNLMGDWQMQDMDVIFCRNVIIYFDRATKARLVDRYADALHEGGLLFIGHSESLFKVSERFELIANTIYRKVR